MPDHRMPGPRLSNAAPRRILIAACGLLVAMLAACAAAPESAAKDPGFPVVVPFAIDRAGSKVTVEFELPNAMEGSRLRPVYVGFRGIGKKGRFTDEELEASIKVTDYMASAPLPVRLELTKLGRQEGDKPVALHDMQLDMAARNPASYHALQGDVATVHGATSMDNAEMIDAGKYDSSKTYHIHEFVRIVPPTPGRYRLEVESLESHTILRGLRYELIVSHYYERGIR